MPARLYDDAALTRMIALRETGATYKEIAQATGASVHTAWRCINGAKLLATSAVPTTVTEVQKQAAAELWYEAQSLAASMVIDGIQHAGAPETWRDIKDAALTGAISADKHLDLTEGRRGGGQIVVDARTQSVALDGMSADDLRALLALARAQADAPALQAAPTHADQAPPDTPETHGRA